MSRRPRIAVTGASGQVGGAVCALGPALFEADYLPFTRAEADLTRPDEAARAVMASEPDLIIHCGAYTAVDRAEDEEALAFTVNAEAPGALARAAHQAGAPMLHVSTDYVFAGDGAAPYRPTDPTGPLSAYGRTKLGGERAVAAGAADGFIVRTAWVYDGAGKNFLRTMLGGMKTREAMKVVDDQIGAPTPADAIARGLIAMAAQLLSTPRKDWPHERIYHMTAGGETSWRGFAQAILEEARAAGAALSCERVDPLTTAEAMELFKLKAHRPAYSRLDSSLLAERFSYRIAPWREAVGPIVRTALADLES